MGSEMCIRDRYRAVTPESIGEVLQKYLTPDKKAVLIARPKAPDAEGAAASEETETKGGESP